jgi:nucleoside-diphosphate-sugar epimerase
MRILITGVAGESGRFLAERLAADPAITQVIGLDARAYRFPAPGVRFVRAELAQPEWTPLLAQIDAAIHLMDWPDRRSRHVADIVEGSRIFLRAAVAAGVRQVIVSQSGAVYGPQALRPIPETAFVHGHQGAPYARVAALISDYVDALEREVSTVFTRLRSAWLVGPHHPTLARYLRSGRALACGYAQHLVQVVHEDDWIEALRLALHRDLPGVYHAAADEGVPLGEAALLGGNRACTPLWRQLVAAWWGWRWRGRLISPAWIWTFYHGGTLGSERLRAAGWVPRYSTRAALELWGDERRGCHN